MTRTSSNLPRRSGPGAALARTVGHVRAAMRKRDQIAFLLTLDDRLLEDMGLSRAELNARLPWFERW